MLTGQSYSSSSQSMTVTSNEGPILGDGPPPPGIAEELLGDLPVYRLALPILPEGLGTAAGPPADGPDAEDDWASGSYGRMKVAHSGGSASGFTLDANYSVDAGGDVPAQATRSLANHQASGYDFSLTSRKDGETGQWQNTAGSRSTWNSSSASSSFIVSGSWGSYSPAFSISGTFSNEQSESNSSSSSSGSELDPQSGAIAPRWAFWDTWRRFVFGLLNCNGQANPLSKANLDGTRRFASRSTGKCN